MRTQCPHCRTTIHDTWTLHHSGHYTDGANNLFAQQCPECKKLLVMLENAENHSRRIVYPRDMGRPPLPPGVPPEYAELYTEACAVLQDSPRASAALSRHCLQRLLREKAAVKHSVLFQEIQEVIKSGNLPTYLADAIDGIRNIGNFAAHPITEKDTGVVVPVESGDAEWLLDTVEALIDFYCVRPAVLQSKRDALNETLSSVGKPPMQ